MALFSRKKRSVPITGGPLPAHIAIIMDGNGRWAKRRGLPRSAGHSAGAATFKTIARYCNRIGIKYMTVYAFSTENWKRSQEEVNGLIDLLRGYLLDSKTFQKENIRLKLIGDFEPLDPDLVALIAKAEEDLKDATGLQVNIAFNYGGRDELVHAARRLVRDGVPPEEITEDAISDRLYTAGIPDPDLVIRPGGEYRLSNYLIWQTAYAEFWFTDVLWPDFSERDIDAAIEAYRARDRRFGGAK